MKLDRTLAIVVATAGWCIFSYGICQIPFGYTKSHCSQTKFDRSNIHRFKLSLKLTSPRFFCDWIRPNASTCAEAHICVYILFTMTKCCFKWFGKFEKYLKIWILIPFNSIPWTIGNSFNERGLYPFTNYFFYQLWVAF